MLAVMVIFVVVPALVRVVRLRSARQSKMSVRASMSVSVDVVSVSMQYACIRAAHAQKRSDAMRTTRTQSACELCGAQGQAESGVVSQSVLHERLGRRGQRWAAVQPP